MCVSLCGTVCACVRDTLRVRIKRHSPYLGTRRYAGDGDVCPHGGQQRVLAEAEEGEADDTTLGPLSPPKVNACEQLQRGGCCEAMAVWMHYAQHHAGATDVHGIGLRELEMVGWGGGGVGVGSWGGR